MFFVIPQHGIGLHRASLQFLVSIVRDALSLE